MAAADIFLIYLQKEKLRCFAIEHSDGIAEPAENRIGTVHNGSCSLAWRRINKHYLLGACAGVYDVVPQPETEYDRHHQSVRADDQQPHGVGGDGSV